MIEPTEADQPTTELEQALTRAIEESKAYEPCMALEVCEEGKAVSLYLDTAASTYSEWIPGEGGDIGLIRCQETKRVMGVRLPLYRNNLVVSSKGPIRINEGFRKGEPQDARQPTEADKAAAEDIARLAKEYFDSNRHTGPLLLTYSAELIAQHTAPERQAAAALREALDAFYKHLDSYGVVGQVQNGVHKFLDESDPEFASQQRCFELYHKTKGQL